MKGKAYERKGYMNLFVLFFLMMSIGSVMNIETASAHSSGKHVIDTEEYPDPEPEYVIDAYKGYVRDGGTEKNVSQGAEFVFEKKGRHLIEYGKAFLAAKRVLNIADSNNLPYIRQVYMNEDSLARRIMELSDGKKKKNFLVHIKDEAYEKSVEQSGELFWYPRYNFSWGSIVAVGYKKTEEKTIYIRIDPLWEDPEYVAECLSGYCTLNKINVLDGMDTKEVENLISETSSYDKEKMLYYPSDFEGRSSSDVEVISLEDWGSLKIYGEEQAEIRIHDPERINTSLVPQLEGYFDTREGGSILSRINNAMYIPVWLEDAQKCEAGSIEEGVCYESAVNAAIIKLRIEGPNEDLEDFINWLRSLY